MILLSHLPGAQPFSSARFDVTAVECVDDLDYSRAVQAAWESPDELVIIEHDVEVSDALISRLLQRDEPLVTYAYILHWVSSHRSAAYCQRAGKFKADRKYLGAPIRKGVQWCDYTGIGFCKIAPEARVRPLEKSHFSTVDMAVNAAVDGRWRVLWPEVEHFHV